MVSLLRENDISSSIPPWAKTHGFLEIVMKKIIQSSLILVAFFTLVSLFTPKTAFASEGTFEIRSTNRESYRCWAASLYMPNYRYRVIIGCIDLIYPPQPPELYRYYIIWANPTSGGKAIRLGELGGGKGNFEVREPFSELFVSLENANNIKVPSDQIVMRGKVEPVNFLLRSSTPTPTPRIIEEEQQSETEKVSENEEATPDTSQLSTREKLVLALKRAGIAAVVALVVIIGLVFVVSRSRG